MKIGRRIYYELATGNVIKDTGERQGSVVETTVDQEFLSHVELVGRVRETVGMIQLVFGQNAQDFDECNGFRVDITGATPTLVFSYPDPNAPEAPPVFQKPLSEEVAALRAKDAEIILTLVMNDLM